jgi:hypothetical protein
VSHEWHNHPTPETPQKSGRAVAEPTYLERRVALVRKRFLDGSIAFDRDHVRALLDALDESARKWVST